MSWEYYPLVVGSSSVVLLAFFAMCTYCFRKRRQTYSDQADEEDGSDEYIDYIERKSTSKLPLISDEEKGGVGGTFHYISSKIEAKFRSSTSPTSPDSPGHGEKALFITTPPGDSYEETGVQPRTRTKSYDSVNSVSSGGGTTIPAEPDGPTDRGEELGSIYFNLSYDPIDLVLKLTIQKAVSLPAKDMSGTSDPFVKVLLLPDKKHKLETRVKRKMLNPIWNEVFTFEGFPEAKLLQRTLYLQVLDYDRFSRNDAIGEVVLPLSDIHLQQVRDNNHCNC